MATEPFVVGYDRRGLRAVVVACLFGILLGAGLTHIGYQGPRPDDGFNLRAIAFLSKFLGPFAVASCAFVAVQTALRKGPALVVAPDGLTIGFLGPAFLLPWTEVAGVYRVERTSQGRTFESLVVDVWDESALLRRLGCGARGLARLARATGQPLAGIGLRLLDRPWPEMAAALDPYVATGPPSLQRIRSFTEAWPKTLEDFQTRFRQAPLGVWTTAVGSYSPADSTVWFCADGSGGVSNGAAGFMGYSDSFVWRPKGDWTVEIHREGAASWISYTYRFEESRLEESRLGESPGKIKADFDIVWDESDPDAWIEGLGYESFSYDGPCRQDR